MSHTEVELKLVLPGASAAHIQKRLSRIAPLSQVQPQQQWLWNRYYDTPDQTLRQQRSALRLRCISDQTWPKNARQQPPAGRWVQTYKTAGTSQGGLSQRGEWESPVASGVLDATVLQHTPWAELDPHGELLSTLQPCFDTHCHRTTWLITPTEGTQIEVALDVGEILAVGHSLPTLELELELISGPAHALFDLARTIARHVTVLPCDISKAERGYTLALGTAHAPARARPVRLPKHTPPTAWAQAALASALDQLTRNLNHLLHTDTPEVVHQTRVAWRRWRTAARLFSDWLPPTPAKIPLADLLLALGHWREIDVTRHETLPPWLPAYAANSPQRQAQATAALHSLAQAAQTQAHAVRAHLGNPTTGQALLDMAAWLHSLSATSPPTESGGTSWARQRIKPLVKRLKKAQKLAALQDAGAHDTAHAHRMRLLAKRLRYSTEFLRPLLPPAQAERWLDRATDLQNKLGAERDLDQAQHWLQQLDCAPGLQEFLRGISAARKIAPLSLNPSASGSTP